MEVGYLPYTEPQGYVGSKTVGLVAKGVSQSSVSTNSRVLVKIPMTE